DGIRDFHVTGVQTCALPILNQRTESSEQYFIEQEEHQTNIRDLSEAMAQLSNKQREIIYLRFYTLLGYDEIANIMSIDKKAAYRSEERRVGKECRSQMMR